MKTETNGVHKNGNDKALSPKNRIASVAGDRKAISTVDKPSPRQTVLWVERLKGDDRQKFISYSDAPRGFITHYTSKGTRICWEDHSLCEGGHKESTMRENFLLHAWSLKLGKQVFAYLTPGACEQLLLQVSKGASMRGMMFTLQRSAKDNGRLTLTVDGYNTGDQRKIPPELDAYDSIMRFVKVPDVDRDYRRALASFVEPEIGPGEAGVP